MGRSVTAGSCVWWVNSWSGSAHAEHGNANAARQASLSRWNTQEIVRTYGEVIGPILDAKLEAKAAELVERYRLAWTSVFDYLSNPGERKKPW